MNWKRLAETIGRQHNTCPISPPNVLLGVIMKDEKLFTEFTAALDAKYPGDYYSVISKVVQKYKKYIREIASLNNTNVLVQLDEANLKEFVKSF